MKLTNWLKQFRTLVVTAVILSPAILLAQPPSALTLGEANALARRNYPALQQEELARLSSILASSNLSKGFLPQFSVNGQATYQSDVTKVNIPFPGISIPTPDKDQYKLTADLSQVIYDGGVIKSQKELQSLNAGIEKQKVEVELYKVRERVNQLFLGILLSDAQLKQASLVQDDIRSGIKRTEAQVANGAVADIYLAHAFQMQVLITMCKSRIAQQQVECFKLPCIFLLIGRITDGLDKKFWTRNAMYPL